MTPQEIARFLPWVFRQTLQRDNPLAVLTEIMAAYITPVENHLERLDATFDPYRASDEFVSHLACWVNMEDILDIKREGQHREFRTLSSGHGRLRELVALSAELAKRRGTSEGLRRMLETATGCPGFQIEEDDTLPYHIRVNAPTAAESHHFLILPLYLPILISFLRVCYRTYP